MHDAHMSNDRNYIVYSILLQQQLRYSTIPLYILYVEFHIIYVYFLYKTVVLHTTTIIALLVYCAKNEPY